MTELKGFASLPADTFAVRPQSGTDNGSIDAIAHIRTVAANGPLPLPATPLQMGIEMELFITGFGIRSQSPKTYYLITHLHH